EPDALDHAGQKDLVDAVGEGGGDRARPENRERKNEGPFPSDPLTEIAADDGADELSAEGRADQRAAGFVIDLEGRDDHGERRADAQRIERVEQCSGAENGTDAPMKRQEG